MQFSSKALLPWTLTTAMLLIAVPCRLSAQSMPALPAVPATSASSLSTNQQAAAKSALCSAVASKLPNPAAAGPSALTDPSVLAAAAPSFASSTKLPLPSATDMLKTYAMQHASDILGSCAASNAASGMTSQIPGGSGLPSQVPGASGLPSMPKLP